MVVGTLFVIMVKIMRLEDYIDISNFKTIFLITFYIKIKLRDIFDIFQLLPLEPIHFPMAHLKLYDLVL